MVLFGSEIYVKITYVDCCLTTHHFWCKWCQISDALKQQHLQMHDIRIFMFASKQHLCCSLSNKCNKIIINLYINKFC